MGWDNYEPINEWQQINRKICEHGERVVDMSGMSAGLPLRVCWCSWCARSRWSGTLDVFRICPPPWRTVCGQGSWEGGRERV